MDPHTNDRHFEFEDEDFAWTSDTRDTDTMDDEPFLPGERIGPPPRGAGSTMLSALLVIALMLAGGWGAMVTRDVWLPWIPELGAKDSATVAQSVEAPAPPPMPAEPPREIAEAPGHDAGTAVPSPMNAVEAAPAEAAQDEPENTEGNQERVTGAVETAAAESEPLPPPVVDPTDPLQKRAFAVGLHPDLSRALLSRMTNADFRNASTAIKKALGELKDGDVLVWPTKAPAKGAQFEVRFVAAAASDCRRYVVTVIKDNWSTTARPMEKCGSELPARRQAARASG